VIPNWIEKKYYSVTRLGSNRRLRIDPGVKIHPHSWSVDKRTGRRQ